MGLINEVIREEEGKASCQNQTRCKEKALGGIGIAVLDVGTLVVVEVVGGIAAIGVPGGEPGLFLVFPTDPILADVIDQQTDTDCPQTQQTKHSDGTGDIVAYIVAGIAAAAQIDHFVFRNQSVGHGIGDGVFHNDSSLSK